MNPYENQRAGGAKSVQGRGAGSSKNNKDSLINPEIDYFNRMDLVDRAITATNYIPRAMRDQATRLKLSEMRIDKLVGD